MNILHLPPAQMSWSLASLALPEAALSPLPPSQKAPGPSPCPQAPVAGACSALESPLDPQHPAIPHFLPSMQQEVVLTPTGITLRGLCLSEAGLEGSPTSYCRRDVHQVSACTHTHTHTHRQPQEGCKSFLSP